MNTMLHLPNHVTADAARHILQARADDAARRAANALHAEVTALCRVVVPGDWLQSATVVANDEGCDLSDVLKRWRAEIGETMAAIPGFRAAVERSLSERAKTVGALDRRVSARLGYAESLLHRAAMQRHYSVPPSVDASLAMTGALSAGGLSATAASRAVSEIFAERDEKEKRDRRLFDAWRAEIPHLQKYLADLDRSREILPAALRQAVEAMPADLRPGVVLEPVDLGV